MKTLSPEEFKKQYGDQAYTALAPKQPDYTNYFQKVASNLGNTFSQGGQDVTKAVQSLPSPSAPITAENVLKIPIEAGNIAGTIAKTAGGIIGSFLPTPPEKSLGKDIYGAISSTIDKIPGMTPDIKQGLDNVLQTALLKVGEKADPAIKSTISKGVDLSKNVVSDVGSKVSPIIDSAKNIVGKGTLTPEQYLQTAIQDATPKNWKSVVGERGIQNADGTVTPRINEAQGVLGKKSVRTVNPDAVNTAAGTELSKLDGYNKIAGNKSTSLQKAQFADNAISVKGKALDTSLQNENILRPPKELNKIIKDAVNTAADRSQLLSKSDPAVKNYLRSSQRIVAESDGTLLGERKVILKLDQAYEDAGGKYANNKPLDQIHRSARQSLINDMEVKAQSTEVKASLKEMENLYHANDVLWDNAKAEGGSTFEQFKKNHPLLEKAAVTGAKAAGFGTGVGLIR